MHSLDLSLVTISTEAICPALEIVVLNDDSSPLDESVFYYDQDVLTIDLSRRYLRNSKEGAAIDWDNPI